ncbi:MAG: hypothetical protein QW835_03765 [Candidatus Hadarchaeum sp.]
MRAKEIEVTAKLPQSIVEYIDHLIKHGLYQSRSEAVSLLIQGYVDNLFRLSEDDLSRSKECREIVRKRRGGRDA